MQIRICLAKERTCGRTTIEGTWLTLPVSRDELEQAMQRIEDNDTKCLIVDFDAPFIIDRYDDVFAINDAAAVLGQYDYRLVYALCGCTEGVDQVIHILKGGHYVVYYDVGSLRDVADELVRLGYYGCVPAGITRFIDYDKMVAELEEAGWHMQYEIRVAVLPLL
ncbi:antirestriction protein ArdA [Paenibacillus thalictri]|uniref:Antirestriction protein ArdA n=1 Tax=Paenibacillus thalictri TaxID=2527873 RepID=A0A4Q9DE81_9BACL|nr:antirestriction protein ArdA [Paenibacillus thalictri]TBL69789.1 antirestriction protein ArdA [Paenibacillus thalictri]